MFLLLSLLGGIIQMKPSRDEKKWVTEICTLRKKCSVVQHEYVCMGYVSVCVCVLAGGRHKGTSSECYCHSNFELRHHEHKNSQRLGLLADYSEK